MPAGPGQSDTIGWLSLEREITGYPYDQRLVNRDGSAMAPSRPASVDGGPTKGSRRDPRGRDYAVPIAPFEHARQHGLYQPTRQSYQNLPGPELWRESLKSMLARKCSHGDGPAHRPPHHPSRTSSRRHDDD